MDVFLCRRRAITSSRWWPIAAMRRLTARSSNSIKGLPFEESVWNPESFTMGPKCSSQACAARFSGNVASEQNQQESAWDPTTKSYQVSTHGIIALLRRQACTNPENSPHANVKSTSLGREMRGSVYSVQALAGLNWRTQ